MQVHSRLRLPNIKRDQLKKKKKFYFINIGYKSLYLFVGRFCSNLSSYAVVWLWSVSSQTGLLFPDRKGLLGSPCPITGTAEELLNIVSPIHVTLQRVGAGESCAD